MERAVETVQEMVAGFFTHMPYLILGALTFLCFFVASRLIRKTILQVGIRTRLDETLARMLGRLTAAGLLILGVLIAAVVVFPGFRPGDLVAGLGITSVAIGFAFKDILQNFFAGVLILWRKPFNIGDQIRTGGFEGTVEDINVRATHITTYDGTRVVIPNGDIYSESVQVLTAFTQRRVMITVGIGYLDNIEAARARIHQVLDDNPNVLETPGPWVYVMELAPSSVNLNVYFWTRPQQANVLKITNEVVTAIKQTLDEGGIDMPYPHNVVLFHDATGTRDGDIDRSSYAGAARPGEQPNTTDVIR